MLLTPDATQVEEFSLPNDTEPKTIFFLGSIDTILLAHISDETLVDDKINIHTRCAKLAQAGIKGWKNFVVEFNEKKHIVEMIVPDVGLRKVLSAEAMELIKPYTIALGNEIFKINYLPPDKLKNLNTPSM
jgi:hypothetical protein